MQVSGGCQKFTNAIFKTLKLEDWNILVKPPPYYYHPRPSIYIFQAFSYYSINTIYSSINTRTRFWKHYSSLVPYPPTPLYPEAKRGPPKLSKSVQTKKSPFRPYQSQDLGGGVAWPIQVLHCGASPRNQCQPWSVPNSTKWRSTWTTRSRQLQQQTHPCVG